MEWPVIGAVTRAVVAVVGSFVSVRTGIALNHIFVAVSLGMLSFGCLSMPGLVLRRGFGSTGRPNPQYTVSGATKTKHLAHPAGACPASASVR